MPPDSSVAQLFTQQAHPLRSLEFFPPKDDAGVESLRQTAKALQRIQPDFVSVTYGAGGSTRERTAQVSKILREDLGFTVMPHLTCVGHSRTELKELADRIHANGFRNIMTLRGDPPKGSTEFAAVADGLHYASELVGLLKSKHQDFCLGVGGYPEKHPEAVSADVDLANLKTKVDAGADFITTQLFFDNTVYFRFVDRCRSAGIKVPIVPGIMPVLSLKQIQRFTTMCGATLPVTLVKRLEAARGRFGHRGNYRNRLGAWADSRIDRQGSTRLSHLYSEPGKKRACSGRWFGRLATRKDRSKTGFAEDQSNFLPLVTLNLDVPVLDGPTTAT